MSFTNSNYDNNVMVNLDKSTLDLLTAAIASNSSTAPTQQNNKQHNSPATTKISQVKRSIDRTGEKEASPVTHKRAGRKPLEKTVTDSELASNPKLKRKAQNRAAQKAFRERKEKVVIELQDRIKELEALTSKTDDDLVQENNRLKDQLKQLQEENYALKGAKFTFEFPAAPESQNDTTIDHGSSNNSAEQSSPSSLTQEDDSDTAASKTPPSFQDPSSGLVSFGPIGTSPEFNNILTLPNSYDTTTKSSYDFNDLFHNKGDLFTNYRTPSTSITDDLQTDDFLLDNSTLPALFGGAGNDLFDFTQGQQAPFSLDQFYTPSDTEPHHHKETLAATLQRAANGGVYAHEFHNQLKNCPDFNLDDLCDELKTKATCTDKDHILTKHDVDVYLDCLNRKQAGSTSHLL